MDTAEPDCIHSSTDAPPQRDLFPVFYEEIVRRIAGLELITPDQCGFKAAPDFRRAGAIDIGDHHGASPSETRAGSEPPPSQSELEPRWQRQ